MNRDLYFWEVDDQDNESLEHYGTRHEGSIPHSGRYPYGSGKNPNQHATTFLATYRHLVAKGLSEKEICKAFKMNSTQLRNKKAADLAKERKIKYDQAFALASKGMGPTAIAKEMSKTLGYEVSESTVRGLLNPRAKANNEVLNNTADVIRDAIKEHKYVDIGKGVEIYMGISADKLKKAAAILEAEGKYEIRSDLSVPQVNDPNKYTIMKVIVPKGTPTKEILQNKDKIRFPGQQTEDGGFTYEPKEPIKNIDSSRVFIKYGDEGGKDKDGVIELRRGVDDLNLGQAMYAQVRIGVTDGKDGRYYLKGMAMYGDDIPKGYDIVFNTDKKTGTPMEKVFKEQKRNKAGEIEDPSNPFGSALKAEEDLRMVQRHYEDKNGKRQLSALNIVREEGDWNEWSRTLASQFLSKQSTELAKEQLSLDVSFRRNEFEKIQTATNPTIRKMLLEDFADECDSAAVHLKAAAMPRQSTKVILPFPELKPNECYAPGYNDGEEVILVRFPHEGTYQIPRLKVNNRCKSAINTIGKNARDAIGIHPEAAEQMSGADFDGDTCIVIPTKGYTIKTQKAIKDLQEFDAKAQFPERPGMVSMGKKGGHKEHTQMGKISNLITDMTLQEAPIDELVRATKYSMTVIDAAKHKLDYTTAYKEFNIQELEKKYQPKPDREHGKKYGGASTLISAAKGQKRITKRKEIGIDPETGEIKYLETHDIYSKPVIDRKTGEVTGWKQHERMQTSTKMYEAKDAHTLSSGHPMEEVYADYANYMKAMGNEARKASLTAGKEEYKRNPSIVKAYENEVNSLKAKVMDAKKNKPLERQAQLIANSIVDMKKYDAKQSGEELPKDEIKKLKNQALKDARNRTGASKHQVYVSDKEWEAIQAGAVGKSGIEEIWKNGDQDRLRSLAMPKETKELAPNLVARIQRMAGKYTQAEIAKALDISASTVNKYL